MDECERAGVAPVIEITVGKASITVRVCAVAAIEVINEDTPS
jgi:hypothetical protein